MYRLIVGILLVLVLAPPPAAHATTLNLSQDLVSLGIASTNMVPNQPSLDAGPLLTQGIEYAKANHVGRVIADPGSYYFLSTACPWCHVQLFGVNDITIDLQGADLVFSHPLQSGIYLAFSNNTVLQNFSVDYQPLPFTHVRVVSVDAANARIQYAVEPGWQDPTTFNSQVPPGPPGQLLFITVHMFRNGQPVTGLGTMAAASPIGAAAFTLIPWIFDPTPANVAKIRVGDVAVLTMRGTSGAVYTDRCAACTFRSIKIYAGPSSAFDAHLSPSNTLERIYTLPKPGTDRLVSAGGINFQAAGPNNQIRLNRAIRTMDDGFGFYNSITGTVQSRVGNRQLIVQGTGNTTLGWLVSVPDGSAVTFQRRLDGAILGSAIVVSQSPVAFSVTYTFDRDLPADVVGAAMYPSDLTSRGAGSSIERNTTQFQALLGTGIDIAGWAGGTVRGNYIRRSALAGIQGLQALTVNQYDWQTTPLIDMTFSNNVIDAANTVPAPILWWYALAALQSITLRTDETGNFTPMPTSPHQNISMTGNFVAYPGRSAFRVGNTTGGTVSGNLLLKPNDRPDLSNTPLTADALLPIVIDRSTGVSSTNNTIDSTSGQIVVTDAQWRELAAYAPGGTIRLNAYNVGTLPTPAVTLTDADGSTLPAAIQGTAAHALDVQVPASAALGGAFVTLTSGGKTSFGTLFIDSQDNIPAVNGCTYEASPSSTSVTSGASSVPILVVTQAGCSYPVATSDPFVTVAGGGTGPGVISASFGANRGPARSATVEIAGQPTVFTQATPGLSFQVLPPCRVLDTRNAGGPLGGPALAAGATRVFPATASSCGIPASASALAVNFTVTRPAAAGSLSADAGDRTPGVPTVISYGAGQTRAANGIVGLATDGSGTIAVTNNAAGTVHLILDVVGYFQ